MRYLLKKEFAKRAGVSRQAVYNAIKREQVIVGKSGKIDVSNKLNKEYLDGNVNGNGGQNGTSKPDKKKPVKSDPEGKTESEIVDKHKPTKQKDLKDLSRNDLDKMKIVADIRQKQVKTEKERELLIPRETVQKVFSKLYMIDVNQWRTLGPGLAPEIASIAGVDDSETILKISEKIDEESFKILKQVKRLFNDYLKGMKGTKI